MVVKTLYTGDAISIHVCEVGLMHDVSVVVLNISKYIVCVLCPEEVTV